MMFWGITLESGKRYTQTIERSFNVTMAALGITNTGPHPVSVLVEINQAQFVLCTLQQGKQPQQALKLKFTEGEHVSFFMEGTGEVHMTGYLLPEPQEYEYSSSEDDDKNEEEESDDEDDEEINSELEDLLADQDPSDSLIAKLKRTKKEMCTPDFVFETASSGDLSEENEDEQNPKERTINVTKNLTKKHKTNKSPPKEKKKLGSPKKLKRNNKDEKQSNGNIVENHEKEDVDLDCETHSRKRKRNSKNENVVETNSDNSSFTSKDSTQKKKKKGK